jgi:hypothetical protein
MFHKKSALTSAMAFVAIGTACGKKSEATDALNGFLQDATGNIAEDAAALAENQSDLMDEIASAINETGSGGNSSSLTLFATQTESGNKTRTCEENTPENGKVTVTLSYVKGQSVTSERKGRLGANAKAVKSEVSGEGTFTRVWTPANAADAKCTTKNHFKFKDDGKSGSALNDLQMTATEARTRSVTVTKNGQTLTGRTMATTGTRNVTFSTTTETGFTYEKTVNIVDVTRTIKLKKPDGSEVERIKKLSTSTPLKVLVSRNSTTGVLEKKVINAGKIENQMEADDVKVTTEFSNLTYDFTSTNTNACTPISGKLSGATFKADAQVKSYVIDYGADTDSGISIALDGAEAVDCPTCVVAQCDFE